MFICRFSKSTGGNVLFISRYSYIRPLSMTRVQIWPNDFSLGSFRVIWGHIRFLPLAFDRIWEYLSMKWDRELGMVPMCFSRTDAWTDMQHDLFGSTRDPTWPDVRSNSDINISRSKCTYFDVSWLQEHDCSKIMSLAFLGQKLFAKKLFLCKKKLFLPLLTCAT